MQLFRDGFVEATYSGRGGVRLELKEAVWAITGRISGLALTVIFRRKKKSVTGTPERIRAARNAWLVAKDAWLASAAALEAHRLEVNRLWLEYLDLADPERARKIR